MAKENDVEKFKDAVEADVAQYEKELEHSYSPVGEFIVRADAEEKANQLIELLGKPLFDRLQALAFKQGTSPEVLAKAAINQYVAAVDKEEAK